MVEVTRTPLSAYDATLCNTLFTWRVYTHPAIPIGPHPHGQGVPSSPSTGTPLSMETPPKSANSDQGLMKKLKGFGGLAMSIGNGHTDSTKLRTENKLSQRFVSLFSFYINFCRFFFFFFEFLRCGVMEGKSDTL
ncbi:G-box-binding factor 2-like [Arachis ipaensis]|uniref:G-box-binding factor 2-like n=1 Tax=Arachis ipaensis TaxID=130454 RepID=UPI000A2B0340|nr:G-box-binding factor 2-like [Arachis ipaensis]